MNDVDTPSIEEVFRSLSLALFGGAGTGGAKSETGHLTCVTAGRWAVNKSSQVSRGRWGIWKFSREQDKVTDQSKIQYELDDRQFDDSY